jgi:hypothetical protein
MRRVFYILMILIPVFSYSKIINVPGDYPTIQLGIDAAQPYDTILVDVGIYYENIIIKGDHITLGSKFLITGDTSYISQTIIDGTKSGTVVTMGPDDVLEPRLAGFTIINGSVPANKVGGGILLVAQRAYLSNLFITSNSAGRGGGIACINQGRMDLSNSIISLNSASKKGGGIYAFISNIYMDQCQVYQNTAGNMGGGALLWEVNETWNHTLHVEISTSYFLENECSQYATGGVSITQIGDSNDVDVTITGSVFRENSSLGNNALVIKGVNAGYFIRNCSFISNEAETYSAGAAFLNGAHGKVVGCLFAGNKAATDGGDWSSGGATVWGGATAEFINCTFTDNEASYGSGLTIGGGAQAGLINCILWGNEKDQVALVDMNEYGGTLGVVYSDLQYGIDSISVMPNSQVFWDEGNIDADPDFTDEGEYPFSLSKLSPCIDAGNPDTFGLQLPQYDMAGNLRVFDGDSSGVAIVDMGAFEYGPGIIGIEDPEKKSFTSFRTKTYPNPLATSTTIEYELYHPERVRLIFYNQSGKQVDKIMKSQAAGKQKLIWSPGNLPDGIYYFRLSAGEQNSTGKLILIQ